MHEASRDRWTHDHAFGQDHARPAERGVLIVTAVTAATMVAELVAGQLFGSLALFADGLHMASHAAALGIALFAYRFARRHARNRRFSFGTGKVNALAAFGSAILLACTAAAMAWEAVGRINHPIGIAYGEAMVVAAIGLAVNLASAVLLRHDHGHHHHHDGDDHHHHDHHHDHNLRAAYMHVVADAATSVLAIAALAGAWATGATWLDPAMALVGAVMVARWAWGLIRSSAETLLDHEAPAEMRDAVRRAIEADGDTRVTDLHLWSVGPGVHTLVLSVVAHRPMEPDDYKALLPREFDIDHPIIEVRRCAGSH